MKKLKLNLAGIFLAAFLFAGFSQSSQLYAQSNVVTVQSTKSYDETVSEIRTLIAKNGMMVLAEINQGKILSMTGLKMNGESLFVGNPQIGKKIFSQDLGAGLAVPVRLNIYEGKDGKTYVNYTKPSAKLASFKNKMIDKIGMMLDKKLSMLTGMIAKSAM